MDAALSRTIELAGADGLRLVADACGDPWHPPVLLVHGGGQTRPVPGVGRRRCWPPTVGTPWRTTNGATVRATGPPPATTRSASSPGICRRSWRRSRSHRSSSARPSVAWRGVLTEGVIAATCGRWCSSTSPPARRRRESIGSSDSCWTTPRRDSPTSTRLPTSNRPPTAPRTTQQPRWPPQEPPSRS